MTARPGQKTVSKPNLVPWALGLTLVAVVGIAGFAGWMANGDTLFWALLQAGLAWCL